MALTVYGKGYKQISSCDTTTSGGTWSGFTFTVDNLTFKEGAAALSCVVKTAGDNTIIFTPTSAVDLSGIKHVRWWILLTHGNILNTEVNGGLQFWVSDGSNTGYWKIMGRDTYPGGWINPVIDVSKACDSGTKPSNMNAITTMGFRINLTAAGKNAINTWFDNLIICDGLIVHGDVGGDYFGFGHIYDIENTATGSWGVLRKFGGQYFSVGSLEIGDSGSTAATKFKAKSSILVFENRRVNNVLYKLNAADGGSDTKTTEFILGDKAGSSGIEGCYIRTQDTSQTCKYTIDGATDADVTVFKLYGTTFFDASGSFFPSYYTASVETLNCNFEQCGEIFPGPSTVKYSNIISADDIGIRISGSAHHVTNCNFISCPNAVELPSTASISYDANMFSNNTYDAINTSGQEVIVNKTNGSNPSNYNPGGSVVVYSASFIHKLTNLVQNTEVTYVRVSDQTVLFNVENVDGTGITEYTHGGGETVDILIHHINYVPDISNIYDLVLPNANVEVKIQQFLDDVYYNPS